MKVVPLDRHYWPRGGFGHWCPGCNSGHEIDTEQRNASNAIWTFNGSAERPSFSPSINMRWGNMVTDPQWAGKGDRGGVCHYFIKTGQELRDNKAMPNADPAISYIQYLGDCTHALKGQTVPLPDIPPGRYVSSIGRG